MTILEQYGLSGIVIAGLAWFVMYTIKEHRKERKDWKELSERQFDAMNKNSNEVTKTISELSTLIKTMKK